MTSEAVFFMRTASSPTEISSGISTFSCCLRAISSWRRCILSRSSWRRLLEVCCGVRCLDLELIFSFLPLRILPPTFSAAILSNFSLYFSMFTAAPPRVSTTRFSATLRGWKGLLSFFSCLDCCAALCCALPLVSAGLAGALFWPAACASGAVLAFSGLLGSSFFGSGAALKIASRLSAWLCWVMYSKMRSSSASSRTCMVLFGALA